jgi:hypothetical protein
VKDSFGSECSDRESSWFLETGFSFQSLVRLVFLYQYAKGYLDSDYRQEINSRNLLELESKILKFLDRLWQIVRLLKD